MANKKYKRLTYENRQVIEKMRNSGISVTDIAKFLNFHPSAIYYELKQGKTEGKYCADYAQERASKQQKEKSQKSILELNPDLSKRISALIIEENLRPKAIIERLRDEGYSHCPNSHIAIYKAIDKGLIPDVTRETLRHRETHMFSNGLIKVPRWICQELNLKDGEDLNIDLIDSKIVIEKATS